MKNIAFQPELRPALPTIIGSKDYRDFRDALTEMDRILVESGIEDDFVSRHLGSSTKGMSDRKRAFRAKTIRKALRHSILLSMTGLSVREFATRLADSRLFQWFTSSEQIDAVRPVAKSTVERFEKMFTDGEVEQLIHDLNRMATNPEKARTILRLEKPLSVEKVFADSTCVEANIHFPTDWVLLRDAVRTLTKAVSLIRDQGLVNRMSPPSQFMKEMNQMCIAMTHAKHSKNAKHTRKSVLRKMKKLTKVVELHAQRHRDLLMENREQTDWSEAEAAQVLSRINKVLEQLPAAIHQAHERLIGERPVKNKDKTFSLYEPDVRVIVRGKAGAKVEFGNGLYLAEQADGLIIDWLFMQNQPPSDSRLVEESIERIEKNYVLPSSFAGDRGFHSKANTLFLEEQGIFNAICPKSVPMLKQRLEEVRFQEMQTRRVSTEARIAILTNDYVGTPLRSKGFKNRNTRIEWCILTHNLWKIAAMALAHRREMEAAQAA